MAPATMKASKSSRSNKKSGHLSSINCPPSPFITPTPHPPPPLSDSTLSVPSFTAPSLPASSLPAPQDIGIHSVVMNPIYRPDPFGVQAVAPTGDAKRELDRKAPWHHKMRNYLKSEVSDLRDRTIHAFSAPHGRTEELRANAAHREEPGESDEDIGTRKARAVSRNWKRTDLMACYIW